MNTLQTSSSSAQIKIICTTTTTLNSPTIVVHNNFLVLRLMVRMRINVGHINFQPTLNFLVEINVDDYFILCYFCPITNIQHVGKKSS